MFGINSESEDSTIRRSEFYRPPEIKKTPVARKKQFPEKRYGNNRESPTYLKIDQIYDNKLSYNNPYLEKKEVKYDINKDEILNRLNSHSPKQIHKLINKLHDKTISESNKIYHDNSFIDKDKIQIKLPKIEAAGLKNVNEYSIQENYKVNEDRIFKFNTKPGEDYNVVLHRKVNFSPTQIKVDKWPLYYEKYYALSNQKNAFHRKGGMFTDAINHKMHINHNDYKIDSDQRSFSMKNKNIIQSMELEKYSNKFKIIEGNFFNDILSSKSNKNINFTSKTPEKLNFSSRIPYYK